MVKKSVIVIVCIILFSFLVIAALYALSDVPSSDTKNFKREFGDVSIVKKKVLNLSGNSYYIAGMTNSQVFLGNRKDSLKLVVTDTSLHNLQQVQLILTQDLTEDDRENPKLKNSYIEIDSPYFFIKAGQLPGLYRGELNRWQTKRILPKTPFFEQAVPISQNSFVMRAILTNAESKTHQNVLYKISENDPEPKINITLLEGQIDELFSTDGLLRYSKKLNLLVYTYAYRNQYLVMDTSLNLKHKGNTIDQTAIAEIKPVEIKDRIFSLASPPAIVNKNTQINEDLLFIHSNVKATNESKNIFEKMSVIDVYNLTTQAYKFSFYIPSYENNKMITFRIVGNKVIALYDRCLISYELKFIKNPFL